jgi:hypothetical protein
VKMQAEVERPEPASIPNMDKPTQGQSPALDVVRGL